MTALYVLHEGEWEAYVVSAPAFVNRDFAELFAGGVPALTPFVVKGPPVPVEVESAARQLVAAELDADAGDLELESAEPVDWSDASLGCPREGEAYAQVITPGYRLAFSLAGTSHAVHTNADGSRVVICEAGE